MVRNMAGENIRDIVNGAQLPRFTNKPISIAGSVVDAPVGGNRFTIRSCDDMLITINLKKPIDKHLEGIVEVHGISQGKTVLADDFIIFEDKEFDVRGHNALCTFLYTVPNIYKVKK